MKRFDFPLERVRRWRFEQLNLEELKLQQLFAERQALERAKVQIRAEIDRIGRDVLSKPSLESGELQTLDSFRGFVRRKLQELANRQQQSEAKIVEQRQAVIEARRQFELLDRLRQTALTEWRSEANKEQETLAAEMFLAKTIRNL